MKVKLSWAIQENNFNWELNLQDEKQHNVFELLHHRKMKEGQFSNNQIIDLPICEDWRGLTRICAGLPGLWGTFYNHNSAGAEAKDSGLWWWEKIMRMVPIFRHGPPHPESRSSQNYASFVVFIVCEEIFNIGILLSFRAPVFFWCIKQSLFYTGWVFSGDYRGGICVLR